MDLFTYLLTGQRVVMCCGWEAECMPRGMYWWVYVCQMQASCLETTVMDHLYIV